MMNRAEAMALIDKHKKTMIDPARMLKWFYLRVIINHLTDEQWEEAIKKSGMLSG